MVALILLGVLALAATRVAVLYRRLSALEEQAVTDPLTGAFNRRQMDASLAAAVDRRLRTGERASLLLLDIDRFKEINDAIGHLGGDRVLQALVKLVTHRLRKLDALFRIGGEEFALLLAGARFSDAVAVAEDLRARVASARLAEGRRVTISVGVSELGHGQTVHSWMQDADAALYRAKRGGRNRVAGTCGEPESNTGEYAAERQVRIPVRIS